MLVVKNIEKLEKLIGKYPSGTMIFNLDKTNKLQVELAGEKETIPVLDILPATDDVEAFRAGDMGLKKVLKRYLARVTKMSKDADDLATAMYSLVRLMTARDRKPYPFIAAVLPETGNKKVDKLYIKALTVLFKKFGIKVETKISNSLKKALKGNKKKVKRAMAEYIAENIVLSDKGEKLYKDLYDAYGVEIMASSLDGIIEVEKKIKGSTVKKIRKVVTKALTKGPKKLMKMYKGFYEELEAAENVIGDLPKLKKIDKLKKEQLMIVLKHLATRRLGAEVGTKEYNKSMSILTKRFEIDKAFAEAMKKSAEA